MLVPVRLASSIGSPECHSPRRADLYVTLSPSGTRPLWSCLALGSQGSGQQAPLGELVALATLERSQPVGPIGRPGRHERVAAAPKAQGGLDLAHRVQLGLLEPIAGVVQEVRDEVVCAQDVGDNPITLG